LLHRLQSKSSVATSRASSAAHSQTVRQPAAKSLGFDSAEAGRASLRQLRLLCLEHIEKVFIDRKEIART
jgi:hypothetical protein